MWRHPKYYKELRKLRNKSDQAISPLAKPVAGRRAPDQGPKRQALSNEELECLKKYVREKKKPI